MTVILFPALYDELKIDEGVYLYVLRHLDIAANRTELFLPLY
jgi:hypothetical protein